MSETRFDYYKRIRDMAEKDGYIVEDYREINYGLQFNILLEGQKSLIRIYESKKGLRTDLSQVKDEGVREMIWSIISGNAKASPGRKGKGTKPQGDPDELIGTDESGKGDYFGPLVIAGVYASPQDMAKLRAIGADDSKKLSDVKIRKIASEIKKLCPYSVVVIGNEKYNELYDKIGNLNKLLAWGHARVIENVLDKVTCSFALSDQFGDPKLIENALMKKGRGITLMQRPRAEENAAVAAASILARDEYVSRIEAMEKAFGVSIPKGASPAVIEAARKFAGKYGRGELVKIAKLHFKTTEQI